MIWPSNGGQSHYPMSHLSIESNGQCFDLQLRLLWAASHKPPGCDIMFRAESGSLRMREGFNPPQHMEEL